MCTRKKAMVEYLTFPSLTSHNHTHNTHLYTYYMHTRIIPNERPYPQNIHSRATELLLVNQSRLRAEY